VSALLALLCAGLVVWALSAKSDNDAAQKELDSTQQELASTQEQLESTKQAVEQLQASEADEGSGAGRAVLAAGGFAAVKALIDDLSDELGATQEDLEAVEQDLEAANTKAEQAEKDADAAKQEAEQAGTETDKAKAEADQASAEVQAAESRAAVARDCAKAYVSALGSLFEGEDAADRADAVREQLAGITSECKAALAG
jgi:chromosome segregation ATPase